MYSKSCAQHINEFERNVRIPALEELHEENTHVGKIANGTYVTLRQPALCL